MLQFVGTHDGVSDWGIFADVVNVVVIHVLAPWCAYWCGAGAAFVAVHGAAELRRMVVP